jgi:branched-subunit amino acid aminotransferase/4-amino-4-deoxychorismate lyase
MEKSSFVGFIENEFIEIQHARIAVDSIAVNRGYGAFDFFGVINKKPFYLDRHLDRFFRTIELLRTTIHFNRNEIASLIDQIIQKNEERDFYIKLFALPNASHTVPGLDSALYIIPVHAGSFDPQLYENGGRLISKEYSRFLPEAKSTNYLPMVFWYPEIVKNQAVDVLYYFNNIVHETSRGNIFMVKEQKVYTPSHDILKGITRSVIIDILMQKNIEIIEKQITLSELMDADEVFLTSTTKKVLPIVRIDDKEVGTGAVGKVTRELFSKFEQLQRKWN